MALWHVEPLVFNKNTADNWQRFKRIGQLKKQVQAYILLNLMVSGALNKFDTFTFAEDGDKEDPDVLIKKFDQIQWVQMSESTR